MAVSFSLFHKSYTGIITEILEMIDVLFPAQQFEIEDNWAGPKGQDRTIITQQLHETIKKYNAFLSVG